MYEFLLIAKGDQDTPWAFVVAVAVFVIPRWLWDIYETYTRTKRLKALLKMECFAILRRLRPAIKHLQQLKLSEDYFDCLGQMPSSLIYADQSPEIAQLLPVLPECEGRDLLKLLDRWARLVKLTNHYEVAFGNAVSSAGSVDESKPLTKRQVREYLQQAVGILNLIYIVANEVCGTACRIIRRYGPHQDCDINKLSTTECGDDAWQNWKACLSERDKFEAQNTVTELLKLPPSIIPHEKD